MTPRAHPRAPNWSASRSRSGYHRFAEQTDQSARHRRDPLLEEGNPHGDRASLRRGCGQPGESPGNAHLTSRSLVPSSLAILHIDINRYIWVISLFVDEKHFARLSATAEGVSCLKTILERRLPNLSAQKELRAAQRPAFCRRKAWLA